MATVRLRGVLPGVAGMILVGSSVGVSATLTTAPLFMAQTVRYGTASLMLLALARRLDVPIKRPHGAEWAWLAGIAATGLVLFNVAIVRGDAHAQPAMIAVAVSCAPVLLGVLGPLLQRQAPQGMVVLSAAVVTAGAALVEGAGRASANSVGRAGGVQRESGRAQHRDHHAEHGEDPDLPQRSEPEEMHADHDGDPRHGQFVRAGHHVDHHQPGHQRDHLGRHDYPVPRTELRTPGGAGGRGMPGQRGGLTNTIDDGER